MPRSRPLLLQSAWLPTPDGSLRAHDILIHAGLIQDIAAPGLAVSDDVAVLPADDHIVIPGLVNAHTHSHLAYGRGFGDRWTLEMHQNSGAAISVGADIDDLRLGAMLNAADMIRHGCVAAYDMVMQTPCPSPAGMAAVAEGYAATGMRAVVAASVTDLAFWSSIDGLVDSLPPDDARFLRGLTPAAAADHLAGLRQVLGSWPFDTRYLRPAVAPSVPLLCSDRFLADVAALARDFQAPLQMHLAESKVQALEAQRRWGASLTSHLSRAGLLGPQVSVAHAVWVDDADLRLLADHGVSVAHNAGSNMRLGNGVAPAVRMRQQGIRVGVGTDGCSCADQQNIIEAMRLAAFGSRVLGPDPDRWLDAPTVFHMATVDSAAVLGFDNSGRLQPGYRADLVFLDRNDLAYTPLNNFWTQFVFSESGRGVQRVMIDGQVVYDQGRFTLFDEARLKQQVNDRVAQLAEHSASRRSRLQALEPLVARFCVGLAKRPHPFSRYIDH